MADRKSRLAVATYDADTNGYFLNQSYREWIEEGTRGFPDQPEAKRELLRFMEDLHAKQIATRDRRRAYAERQANRP